ncbi:hypothetical protein [Magnetospirillum aberrantis]|uniref:Uncharacterized protein n=1 Tax=Magnetospirillum aberrantis SpK TaxID=908842 RepID=A0A7C9QTC2_9PROT|nr:hypothetical protein [Magnetospirillum aberrantis]NFV80044.1 hypothetical protein [Magnetospirillum aberrantis SpK]
MRLMPARTVTAAKPHRCAFCGQEIAKGVQHLLFRAFDPDHSKDGGKTWGAWVQERWHVACRYPSGEIAA